jgi:hypothetical protein
MFMKLLVFIFSLVLSVNVFSHDGIPYAFVLNESSNMEKYGWMTSLNDGINIYPGPTPSVAEEYLTVKYLASYVKFRLNNSAQGLKGYVF